MLVVLEGSFEGRGRGGEGEARREKGENRDGRGS